MSSNTYTDVYALEKATEAARNAGAKHPEAVAEFLKNDLVVEDSASGPQVFVRNGLELESLNGVFARMQVSDNVASLFTGGKVDVRKIDHDLYRAIRKHAPEMLGLRPNRR